MYRKKIFYIGICFFLTLVLSTCSLPSADEGSHTENEKISIVATIFPQYDFARNVAGSLAKLTLLLPPGGESHSYEPSPKDMIQIQESDLFIYVGGESDQWIEDILQTLDTSKITTLKLMDCVDTVYEEVPKGLDAHEEKHVHGSYAYDEHVWTSPKNAQKITQAICDTLCTLDPENTQTYTQNCASYLAKLQTLDQSFEQTVAAGKRNVMVFGDRFPFRYFSDAYGLAYFAAFPGCSSETEPSAATLAFLTKKIEEENIPVVFYIEMSSQKVADALCEDTGAKKLLFHSCHNLTNEEFERGENYLSLMEDNLENLKTALN